MNLAADLERISALSADDRIRLVEAIWDSIPERDKVPALTDDQQAELTRRLEDLRAHPERGLTWDELLARVKGRS